MAEQEKPEVQVQSGRRATLQEWATVPIFNFYINIRILLEPIGILRIILVVLTLLAFSLTAGFSNSGNSNRVTCLSLTNTTQTVTLMFGYPFNDGSFSFNYDPPTNSSSSRCRARGVDDSQAFGGSAEFFVFMSVVSFIFGIVMVIVYVITYSPKYQISKYVAIVDFFATLILAFFYFLADIAWSAGTDSMRAFNMGLLKDRTVCYNCTDTNRSDPVTQNFAQLRFSLLFGWIAMMVLVGSLWFAYKDTLIHINKMGPCYRMSFYKVRRGDSSAAESQKVDEQHRGYEPSPSPPPGVYPDDDLS